jgi:hypothetical protein
MVMPSCQTARAVKRTTRFLLTLIVVASVPARADDGAASIAAGGIMVVSSEAHMAIAMVKEVLRISPLKVVVDYDFRNDSDDDINAWVDFPIPNYARGANERDPSQRGFDDFKLWINGAPARYQVKARALLNDTDDYTELLTGMHVGVATSGYSPSSRRNRDIDRLTAVQRKRLEEMGLIDENDEPLWQVDKNYHWQQTFAAHKSVHIRSEYSPVLGSSNFRYFMTEPDADGKTLCIDDKTWPVLDKLLDDTSQTPGYSYVDFALTTANAWKMPIEDLTLIVERPRWKGSFTYVSFCWDGPVTKLDADHFSAHATGFVPKKDLRIGFIKVRKP